MLSFQVSGYRSSARECCWQITQQQRSYGLGSQLSTEKTKKLKVQTLKNVWSERKPGIWYPKNHWFEIKAENSVYLQYANLRELTRTDSNRLELTQSDLNRLDSAQIRIYESKKHILLKRMHIVA